MRPTKTLFNLQVPVTKGLKTGFRRRRRRRRRRRLVDGSGFERMRVGTLTMIFSVTYYS
jgi:hypothetical protein